jgi:hypothetical protein
MTVAEFKAKYPEFTEAGDPLIQEHLDDAAAQTDAEIWGDKSEIGIGLMTAHLMALSPYGRNARLEKEPFTTIYGERLRVMQSDVASGHRVI